MALKLLAANNAQTVLAAGINSSATSLTVNSGAGSSFPAPSPGVSYFKLTIVDAATGLLTEIVHVTARIGDTMTIERGKEGTVARAWSANDIAANMMTAGTLSLLAQTNQSLQIENNLSEIKASGTTNQASARLNIGLGTSAIKDVGVSAGNIPDMSSFAGLRSANGWQMLPGGLILQWGSANNAASATSQAAFTIPFPTACLVVIPIGAQAAANVQAYVTLNGSGRTDYFTWQAFYANGGSAPSLATIVGQVSCRWWAIGY